MSTREVAQPGSAHAWGAWGRRFKSCHPDFLGLSYIYLMEIDKKLISQKKPFYPISKSLKLFLEQHDRWMDDVISYEDLLRYSDSINLYDKKNTSVKGFSGGMKQRIGIAQALIGNPKILIVDEPTAGLDPGERNSFYDRLSDVGKDVIVILSTHIVDDVR